MSLYKLGTTTANIVRNDNVTQAQEFLQGLGYTDPITISAYQRFQWVREALKNEGVNIPLNTGN